jgi:hypothetical protein
MRHNCISKNSAVLQSVTGSLALEASQEQRCSRASQARCSPAQRDYVLRNQGLAQAEITRGTLSRHRHQCHNLVTIMMCSAPFPTSHLELGAMVGGVVSVWHNATVTKAECRCLSTSARADNCGTPLDPDLAYRVLQQAYAQLGSILTRSAVVLDSMELQAVHVTRARIRGLKGGDARTRAAATCSSLLAL